MLCLCLGLAAEFNVRWRKKYGGMDKAELARRKELEKENSQLKKLVADLALDKSILEEALKGKC